MEDLTGITGNSYVVVDLQKIKRNVEKIRAHIGENVKFLPVHFSEIVDLRIMLFLHLLYLALQFFNIGVPF